MFFFKKKIQIIYNIFCNMNKSVVMQMRNRV